MSVLLYILFFYLLSFIWCKILSKRFAQRKEEGGCEETKGWCRLNVEIAQESTVRNAWEVLKKALQGEGGVKSLETPSV